mmetsp:Transcript_84445/g.215010  ORF Transcript_84445/g.215010 Transcript_84445/m.215010 type:complete len:331 (+) Transcript_84445:519-1511(+)
MADDEAVGAAGEAAVGHQGDVLAQARTHDRAGRGQHLAHARAALGPLVADDDEVSLIDLALLQALEHKLLAVEDIRLARELHALLARDLRHAALGAEAPTQDFDVPGGLNALVDGSDHILLVEVQIRHTCQVLCECLARDRHAIAMQPPKLEKVLHHRRSAADPVNILHAVGAAGLQIGDERCLLTDTLEVVDVQVDVRRGRDGQQVQHCVRGASKGVHHDDGVFHRLLRQDVRGPQVALQDRPNRLRDALALVALLGGDSRVGGGERQRQTHGLDGTGHGVGRVHPAASSRTRARMFHDVGAFSFIDTTNDVLAVGLEGGNDVKCVALV